MADFEANFELPEQDEYNANLIINITPTKTSDLQNDGDGVSPFTTKNYVDENLSKIEKIQKNNVDLEIVDKTVNIEVPTDTSDLSNGAGYITADYHDSTKQDVISDLANIITGASKGNTALQPNDNVSELTNDANYQTSSQVSTAISDHNDSNSAHITLFAEKQDELISGVNIKTINNQSLLGSGNIDIQGGGSSYTAGTGIDIDSDNAINIKQIGTGSLIYNYTPVGTITETNGVLTGFSDSNYATTVPNNFVESVAGATSWEMCFKFTTQSLSTSYYQTIWSAGSNYCTKFLIGTNKKMECAIRTGSVSQVYLNTGTTIMMDNTTYWAKLTYYHSVYRMYLSTDGTDYHLESTTVLASSLYGLTTDGSIVGRTLDVTNRYFRGSIDLNGSYIKINDNYWWQGATGTQSQGVAIATNSTYGLVKPDNSTITVNDGVIMSTLSVNTGLSLSSNQLAIVQTDVGTASYNYIPLGSITESGGIISNFSAQNYAMTIPNNFSQVANSAGSWEMVFKFTYATDTINYQNIWTSSESSASKMVVNTDGTVALGVKLSGALTNINGTTVLTNGSTYWIKGEFTGSAYNLYLSSDGITYTLEGSSAKTTRLSGTSPSCIGCNPFDGSNNKPFKGTIDLNGSYIKINDNYWWQGVTYTPTSEVAKATNSLYGLVKPDGSTITINDGVISANAPVDWTSITGYNALNTQVLKNVNGVIRWENE